MIRFLIITTITLFSIINVDAQNAITGVVVDNDTGLPVETANVQLLSGSSETPVSFTFTDAKGAFNIKSNSDSLQIMVSLMGYKTHKQAVKHGDNLTVRMEEQSFNLQEVVVRTGRVWNSRDTINYDVDRFISAKDETIKDVLKKLPGVDVDESGKISYNGKDISNFYVEGMDPVGGRYNQISNNLRAEAVQTVQVMENHQPVKMLQDIIDTDDVALNLKLKDDFQSVWMFSLYGALGASPLLWNTSANAMQLSRASQSIYNYKANNTGNDVTSEQMILGIRGNSLFDASMPEFLNQPSIMAPLKKERLLFNDVHAFSANRLYKLNETTQMHISANYTHDKRTQKRGSETSYYQQNDTVYVEEQSSANLRSDEAALNVNIENNASGRFLTNNFGATGNFYENLSDFVGNRISFQDMRSSTLGASNDFRNLWGKGRNKYEIRSLLKYNHQPEELRTDSIRQKTELNRFYTNNSFGITRLAGYFTYQNNAGFTGDINNVQSAINLYTIPLVQLNKDKWNASFRAPLLWTNYYEADFSRFSARPSVSVSYKYNYAWRFFVSGGYNEQYGDVLNFYGTPYYADYRHIVQSPDNLPVQQIQNYSVSGEYKKTANEFFASLRLSYISVENSHIYEQRIENGNIIRIPWKQPNQMTSRIISGSVSKGFFDAGLQTSISYQLSQSNGKQISQNKQLPFQSNRIEISPKINWAYFPGLEINYSTNINLAESKVGENKLSPLWNILQKFQVSYELTPVEINVSTDHYYNEISSEKAVNDVFVDVSLRMKLNKWRFSASANNLMNKKQYSYTQYSAIQSYSSWIDIRGREFLVGVQYRF